MRGPIDSCAHAAEAIGFVQSDYTTVYAALQAVLGTPGSACRSFCEWGSGLGVVTSLASMLELSALWDRDRPEAGGSGRRVGSRFRTGCRVHSWQLHPAPGGSDRRTGLRRQCGRDVLARDEHDNAYDELGLDVDDFDLIFAYPWPGEQQVVEQLFDRFAARGALLLLYDQFDSVRLLRKAARSASR